MYHIIDPRTKEQRKAAEAESKRPITWDEYKELSKNMPMGQAHELQRRVIPETVPADIRPIWESCIKG